MSKLAKLEIWGALFGIILGTLLHFTYAWSGDNVVVGLFSSITESVWEHTKLLVTPIILFSFVEWYVLRNRGLVYKAKAAELMFTVLFIIVFFYTYTGAFGIEENLLVDICSFIVAVIAGKVLSYRILKKSEQPSPFAWSIIVFVLILISSLQIAFTFVQPDIPLFQEHIEEQL